MPNVDPPTASEEWRRLHATVHGHVQGVSFRYETVSHAESLGVVGYVRNLRDRTVEVVAEGPAASLERLLAWLHRGPAAAHVTAVDVIWETPQHEFYSFEVRW